jgi:hypothetical protein
MNHIHQYLPRRILVHLLGPKKASSSSFLPVEFGSHRPPDTLCFAYVWYPFVVAAVAKKKMIFAGFMMQIEGTSLVSLSSLRKINNIFKLEVSYELPSLVAPLYRRVDGIVTETNNTSDPPFHVDQGDAIY